MDQQWTNNGLTTDQQWTNNGPTMDQQWTITLWSIHKKVIRDQRILKNWKAPSNPIFPANVDVKTRSCRGHLLELILRLSELLSFWFQESVHGTVLIHRAHPLTQRARRYAALLHHHWLELGVVIETFKVVKDPVGHVFYIVELQIFEEVVPV